MNVEYNIPFALWLRKARMLHSRKEQEFGKPHPLDQGVVMSLKEQCRQTIVSTLTLENIYRVAELPLPNLLKNYISNLNVDEDFDLHGQDMEFASTFAYKTAKHYTDHLHHTNYYIFPTKFLYDNTEVIIKVFHNTCNWCDTKYCEIEQHDLNIFQNVRHPNLQTCYATIISNVEPSTYFVIEKSAMSLSRMLAYLATGELFFPEHIIWKLFHDMASIVNFFYQQQNCSLRVQLDSFTISLQGRIQLENPLLTIPEDAHGSGNHSWIVGQDYKKQEASIVSSLGRVLFQLVTLRHTDLIPKDQPDQINHESYIKSICKEKTKIWFSHINSRGPPQYKKNDYLLKLIKKCICQKRSRRPTLLKLMHKLKKQMELATSAEAEVDLNRILLKIPTFHVTRFTKGSDNWWKDILTS